MRILMIGPLPKDVGGTYTTGICKVVYELSKQQFEGAELYISSTNIPQRLAERICEYKDQYNGYQWPILDILLDFLFHPICSLKELLYYKDNSRVSVFRNFFYKANIRRHIRRINPDLIHVHTTETLPTFFANKKKVPMVCTMHGVFYRGLEGQERLGTFLRACVDCSNYFTGLTLECEELMKKYLSIPAEKLFIIPNGVNTSIYYYSKEQRDIVRKENKVKDEIVFITVASIQERKGQLRFIKLLEKLDINYRYWILGDGPDKQKVQDYCESAGLSDRVACLGSINSSELYKYYSAADIYAHASSMEGQALCEMEAYATGIRIIVNKEIKDTIATDIQDIKKYYVTNLESANIDGIKNWIMKGNPHRESRVDMSWASIAEQYNKVYKKIYDSHY